jgi:hypothetical protein
MGELLSDLVLDFIGNMVFEAIGEGLRLLTDLVSNLLAGGAPERPPDDPALHPGSVLRLR